MSDPAVLPYASRAGPPWNFRLRRGRNWFFIGLNYAAYYTNRYNLSFAGSAIRQTFGFSNAEYGMIQSGRNWSYALGQFVNGLIADRIGGKMTMAIGGYGTAVMNVLFGLGFYYQKLGPMFAVLWWYVALRSIDGYIQAFGAPGMVKINAAWFARPERGRFSGIFGLMINLGRIVNNTLSAFLLAGFTLWSYTFPPGSWQLVFFVPAGIVIVITTLMLLLTKATPEDAGFGGVIPREPGSEDDRPLPIGFVFRAIMSNKFVWLTAWAYFCTGVVRYGIDDWFPMYFQEERGIRLTSATFQIFAWLLPLVATLGSITSGYVSDLAFKGRRAPVAVFLYFAETAILLIGAQLHSLLGVSAALILVAFTCNATHSILGAAAPMDFGGRKMAGFACGVIDSFQYIGAGIAGVGFGKLIDLFGWGTWLYAMAGFGIVGGVLMLIMNRWERQTGQMGPTCAFPVVPDESLPHR